MKPRYTIKVKVKFNVAATVLALAMLLRIFF